MHTAIVPICALAALLAGTCAIAARLLYRHAHPARLACTEPLPPDLPLQEMALHSADNTRIAAWLVTAGTADPAPAIVVVHGLGEARHCYLDAARHLRARGFHVLLIDLRGHGDSGGSGSTLGLSEPDDIRAAVQLLRQRADVDQRRIGLLGFSLGATAALRAAATCPEVHAVTVDSPFADLYDQAASVVRRRYRLPAVVFAPLAALLYRIGYGASMRTVSAVTAAQQLGCRPLLLITGDDDQTVPADHPRRIVAAAAHGRIWVIDGAGHSDTRECAGAVYWSTVIDFFATAPPSKMPEKVGPTG